MRLHEKFVAVVMSLLLVFNLNPAVALTAIADEAVETSGLVEPASDALVAQEGEETADATEVAEAGEAAGEVGQSTFLAAEDDVVAQVGDDTYASLAAAVAAVPSDGTVTLLADVTLGSTLTIDKAMTLDLGTHTISPNEEFTTGEDVSGDYYIPLVDVTSTGDLTLTGTSGTVTTIDNNAINVSGALTVKSGVTVAADDDVIFILDKGAVTIDGGTVQSYSDLGDVVTMYGQQDQGEAACLTVNSGKLLGDGVYVYSINNGANITINGGEFQEAKEDNDCFYLYSVNPYTTTLNITGGTFDYTYLVNISDNQTVSITGGTFNEDVSDYVADGFAVVSNGDGTYSVADEATLDTAAIGDTAYKTLAGAFEAASAGDTITLLRNVKLSETLTIDKSVTLDLGTYTLSSSFTTSQENPLVDVAANTSLTLTGTDGTISTEGAGCVCLGGAGAALTVAEGATVNSYDCSVLLVNSGQHLTVNGGTVSTDRYDAIKVYEGATNAVVDVKDGEVLGSQGIYCRDNTGVTINVTGGSVGNWTGIEADDCTDLTINVSGGTVKGTDQYGISLVRDIDTKVNVTGGSIVGIDYGIWATSSMDDYESGSVEINMSGGSVTARNDVSGSYGIGNGEDMSGFVLDISGGTVKGYTGSVKLLKDSADHDLTSVSVSGGTLNGAVVVTGEAADQVTGFITGGTFMTTDGSAGLEPSTSHVADGYIYLPSTSTVVKDDITFSIIDDAFTYDGFDHMLDVMMNGFSFTNAAGADVTGTVRDEGTFVWTRDGDPVDELKDAGTYTLAVTYRGETYTDTLTISKRSISTFNVTATSSRYTGQPLSELTGITFRDENGTEVTDVTYTIQSPGNYVNAGIYNLTVEGTGNYTGSTFCQYGISSVALDSEDVIVTLDQTVFGWDYSDIEPGVTVTFGDQTLRQGTDYTVVYSDNDGPGTGHVTVSSDSGNFAGSKTVDFAILSPGNVNLVHGGSTISMSLDDALAYAVDGDTIQLTEDVVLSSTMTISEDITLDLGTHKITKTEDFSTFYNIPMILVASGATVTIDGDDESGAITNTDKHAITVNGTLILEGGTISANDLTVFFNAHDASLVVNGGAIYGTLTAVEVTVHGLHTSIVVNDGSVIGGSYALYAGYQSGARITVNGGTVVSARTSAYIPAAIYAYETTSSDPAVITVTGGAVSGTGDAYGIQVGGSSSSADITITGGFVSSGDYNSDGIFVSPYADAVNLTISDDAIVRGTRNALGINRVPESISITGGSFAGGVAVTGASQFVTGGTFRTSDGSEAKALNASNIADGYAQDGEGTVYKIPAAVVTHEGTNTPFDTIEEAIAAAESGDTVTLYKNAYPEGTLVIDKALTLDLANCSITPSFATSMDSPLISVTGTDDLTIQGNESSGTLSAGAIIADDKSYGIVVDGGSLTVEGGIVSFASRAIVMGDSASVTIDGGYVSAGSHAITFFEDDETLSTLVVSDGVVEASSVAAIGNNYANASITVSGGTVRATGTSGSNSAIVLIGGSTQLGISDDAAVECEYGSVLDVISGTHEVQISGGTFKGTLEGVGLERFVTGGTFLAGDGSEAFMLDETYLAEGYVQNDDGAVVYSPVATVTHDGTTSGYNTLGRALEVAQDGDTVTLCKNVALSSTLVIDKSITLDLGEYKLSNGFTTSEENPLVQLGEGASVTLSGTDGYLSTSNEYAVELVKNSTLTINDGVEVNAKENAIRLFGDTDDPTCSTTLNVAGGGVYSSTDNAVRSVADANCVINVTSGYVIARDSDAILVFDATVNVSGGYVRAQGKTQFSTGIAIEAFEYAHVNITGGTVEGEKRAVDCGFFETELHISGGLVTGHAGKAIYGELSDNSTVTGGQFIGAVDVNGEKFISGGTFISFYSGALAVDESYLADHYRQDMTTGTVYEFFAATITHDGEVIGYYTLPEALTASQDGDIVTIYESNADEQQQITNAITLDLNGFELAHTVAVSGSDAHLTVQDSSTDGNGKISGTTRGVYVTGGASFTLKSGTLSCTDKASDDLVASGIECNGADAILIDGGRILASEVGIYDGGASTITIANGVIRAESDQPWVRGIHSDADGTDITISGGSIQAVSTATEASLPQSMVVVVAGTNTSVTVSGGSHLAVASADDQVCYAIWAAGSSNTVTLDGGTLGGYSGVYVREASLVVPVSSTAVVRATGDAKDYAYDDDYLRAPSTGDALVVMDGAQVSVAGGTFRVADTAADTAISLVEATGETGTVQKFITGGTFVVEPADGTIADGYEWSATTQQVRPVSLDVIIEGDTPTYDGLAHVPETLRVLAADGTDVTEAASLAWTLDGVAVDSPVDAGTYVVTATVGQISGTGEFVIAPHDISGMYVYTNAVTFTGFAPHPQIELKDGPYAEDAYSFVEGKDYDISAVNEGDELIERGYHDIDIVGTGNYTGTLRDSVLIDWASFADVVWTTSPASYLYDYSVSSYEPEVIGTYTTKDLEGNDQVYTLKLDAYGSGGDAGDFRIDEYFDNHSSGTAKVVVSSTGENFDRTGSPIEIEFKIFADAYSVAASVTTDDGVVSYYETFEAAADAAVAHGGLIELMDGYRDGSYVLPAGATIVVKPGSHRVPAIWVPDGPYVLVSSEDYEAETYTFTVVDAIASFKAEGGVTQYIATFPTELASGTYKLLNDVRVSEPLLIADGASVTFDLNAHTLSTTVGQSGGEGQSSSFAPTAADDSAVIIADGTDELTITDTSGEEGGKLSSAGTCISIADDATVTISGGSFEGDPVIAQSGGTLTITGGTFEGDLDVTGGSTAISGGWFSQVVDYTLCAQGYIPTYTADTTTGMYTVVVGAGVARIGNVVFETLQEAADAAQEGDTIVLLADIEGATETVTFTQKDVTLDLAGHTYTFAEGIGTAFELSGEGDLTVTSELSGAAIYSTSTRTGFGTGITTSSSGTLTVNNVALVENYFYVPAVKGTGSGDIVISGGTHLKAMGDNGALEGSVRLSEGFTGNLTVTGEGTMLENYYGAACILSEATSDEVTITVTNGASAYSTGQGGALGIKAAGGTVRIVDGGSVYSNFTGIVATGAANVVVSDATIYGGQGGTKAYCNDPIKAESGSVLIEDGAVVKGDQYAIYSTNGTVTVKGGEITSYSDSSSYAKGAIWAPTVSMTGGTITGLHGILSSGTVEVSGGTINATSEGNSQGIAIEFEGSGTKTLKISGDDTVITSGRWVIYNRNAGTLAATISGGTMTGAGSAISSNQRGDVITMTGGTLTGTSDTINFEGGTVNLSGTAKVVATSGNAISQAVVVMSDGEVIGSNSGLFECSLDMSGGSITGQAWYGATMRYSSKLNSGLTMTDGSITGAKCGIYADTTESASFSITGGTITGSTVAGIAMNAKNATLTIANDAVVTGATGVLATAGTVSISGGTVTGTGEEAAPTSELASTGDALAVQNTGATLAVSVTDGAFKSANGAPVASYATGSGTEALGGFLAGGIYSAAPDDELVITDGMVVANTDEATKVEYPHTIFVPEPVAKIGDVTYRSLASAFAAAGADDTVTLIADVELAGTLAVDKNITLDLAGYYITADDGVDTLLSITSGTFTLTDSSDGPAGTLSAAQPIAISGGTLSVSGGTVAGAGTGIAMSAAANVTVSGSATVSASATNGVAIALSDATGTLALNGGAVTSACHCVEATGESTAAITLNGSALVAGDTGISMDAPVTTTLKAGTITAEFTGVLAAAGTLTVPSSSTAIVTSEVTAASLVGTSVAQIAGGTFKSNMEDADAILAHGPTGFITGGLFSSQVPYAMCGDGYMSTTTPNDEGLYAVQAGDPVALVNGFAYLTLDEAFASVKDASTIELLKDVTLTEPLVYDTGVSATLYLNYYGITAARSFSGTTLLDVQSGSLVIDSNTSVNDLYGLNANSRATSVIAVGEGASVEVRSLTITGATYGIDAAAGSTVIVNAASHGAYNRSYTIDGVTTAIRSNGARVTVKGESWIANNTYDDAAAIELLGGDVLTMDAGKITGNTVVHQAADAEQASTININGGTMTVTSSGNYISAIVAESDVTINISGGTVTSGYRGDAIQTSGRATITMTDGTLTRGTTNDGYGIRAKGEATITVEGGSVDAYGYGIGMSSGTLAISGGTISGNFAIGFSSYVSGSNPGVITATITGGSLEGGKYGINEQGVAEGSAITMSGNALVKGGTNALHSTSDVIEMQGGYVGDRTADTMKAVPEGMTLIASQTHSGYYELHQPADLTELNAAIAAAQTDLGATEVSTDGNDVDPDQQWVTQEVKDALAAAISAAQLVAANEAATQNEVDEAAQTVREATFAFDAVKKAGTPDKSALTAAIAAAHADVDATEVAESADTVPQGTQFVTQAVAQALADAIAAAQGIASDPSAKIAQIAEAAEALAAAQATFDAAKQDGTFVAKAVIERIAGDYANETSALISQAAFESAGVVVLARDDDFADALGATGLAGVLDCPIVLTDRTALSEAAAAEINRLGATKVYIIGGTGAMKEQLEIDLANQCEITDVERLWGENSYDTSLACAKAIVALGGNDGQAIIAMSTNFQDALSMSSFAYKYKVPVVLQTWGDTSADRGFTDEAASWLEGKRLFVAGGAGAISEESVEPYRVIVRLWGETGYDTSLAIARFMVGNELLDPDNVIVTCGAQAPKGVDALAGAALGGRLSAPILLVNTNEAMEEANTVTTDTYLGIYKDYVKHAYVLGGAYVVPQALYDSIRDMLGAEDLSA